VIESCRHYTETQSINRPLFSAHNSFTRRYTTKYHMTNFCEIASRASGSLPCAGAASSYVARRMFTLFTLALACNQALAMMQSQSRDYCEAETFHANCAADQVVLMSEALYGRMEVGRCVTKDYGYVGCQVDVTDHMDNSCSGRRSCELRIPDASLDRARTTSTCPADFRTYLKASYECVQVHNPPCRPCRNYTEVAAVSRVGYLASIVTEESGCGGDQCPYLVKAKPGQTLNLTLLDFGFPGQRQLAPASNALGLPVACMMYAIVNEKVKLKGGKIKDRELKVCAGNQRETNIFHSETESVKVKMFSRNQGSSSLGQFMIKYQVMGCADYDAPRNTWVKRDGDGMEIGCVSTGEKWDMTCIEGEWAGEIGICPPAPPASSAVRSSHILSIPMAVILAIAMIIGVVILTAGLIVIKRRRQRAAALRQAELMHQEHYMKGMYGAPMDLQKSYIGDKTIGRYQYTHGYHEPQGPPIGYIPPNGYISNPNHLMRPLPSIPDIPAAVAESDQNNAMTRSTTGDNLMSQSARSNGGPDSFRPRHSSVDHYSPHGDDGSVSRQYFVLDPEDDPMLRSQQGREPDTRYGEGPVSPADSHDNFVRGLCQPGTICNHNPSCFANNHVQRNGVNDSSKYSWP